MMGSLHATVVGALRVAGLLASQFCLWSMQGCHHMLVVEQCWNCPLKSVAWFVATSVGKGRLVVLEGCISFTKCRCT